MLWLPAPDHQRSSMSAYAMSMNATAGHVGDGAIHNDAFHQHRVGDGSGVDGAAKPRRGDVHVGVGQREAPRDHKGKPAPPSCRAPGRARVCDGQIREGCRNRCTGVWCTGK